MKGLGALIFCLCLLVVSDSTAQDREQTTTDGDPPVICAPGALVEAMLCEGSFCDDITIRCTASPREVRRTFWTRFVYHAGSGDTAVCGTPVAGPRGFMSGIACEGDWCDNVAMQCTELELFEPDFDDCVRTDWFSEEEGLQTWASPFHFPVSLRCWRRDHCDKKIINACRLKRRDD